MSNELDVIKYYEQAGSRLGYRLFLRGTKHFGYYRHGESAWAWPTALRRMEDKLADALGQPPGARVLDAGCGVGDVAGHLARHFGLRVCGVDVLDRDIAVARRRARRRGLSDLLTFRPGNYTDLPFPAGSFDAVYTMETLVHAAAAETVLREFHRVLRPGGRLVMFEYAREPAAHMPPPAAETFRQLNEWAAMPSFQRFDYGTLRRLVADTGFSAVTVDDISHHMWPMLRCFAAIGRVPYAAGRSMGRSARMVNSMAAVEFWRYRAFWRYEIYGAVK
ncbi:class I SAM-dependent methyltransferase [Streptomyces sp. NPDC048650]|uniref:class I SAM-dependent methyltransferase n=1 Tax=Streptomyces sp. NPDC048650 TaxID=3365583 RepID=UPI003720508E